ncbi:MAG: DUF1858 domain-containing protein [Myxococcaceae bacterium]
MKPITSKSTVQETFDTGVSARLVLRSKGIDTCCGGGLTLEQAAAARGLPLDELMAAVLLAVPPELRVAQKAEGQPIVGEDSVRAVIARYPQAVAVFEKAGLMGCGGAAGPEERIDLFATIHRLDAGRLLAELNEAAAKPAEEGPARTTDPGSTLYRRFLKAGLWSTVTLGASFGAYNLLAIHLALGPVLPSHQWVHAGFQLFGFVLLLVMGVGYHTLPRFLGTELALPKLARATFWLGLSSLFLVGYARCGHWVPRSVEALGVGALLQLAAVLGWAVVLVATFRKVLPSPDLFHRFLGAGTLWWIAAAGFLLAGAVTGAVNHNADTAVEWNEALYAAALLGGALSWIQGMFLRTGPVFLGLRPTRTWLVKASFVVGQAGVLLVVTGGATVGLDHSTLLTDAGLLALAFSVAAFAVAVRPFSFDKSAGHLMPGDRDFQWLVRLAFGSSLLFSAFAALYAVTELSGREPDRFIYDGARHAMALGFVTTMIFAMAGRVVPIFGGAELQWPALRRWGSYLIAAGIVLREMQVVEALLKEPRLLWLSGTSGVIAATGVCLATASILRTLQVAARQDAPAKVEGRVEIAADELVYRLITAHGEAIPLLIEAGFTPLANPVLRRTLTRAITLRQACKMQSIELEPLLQRIRAACPHGPASPATGTPARSAPASEPTPQAAMPPSVAARLGALL